MKDVVAQWVAMLAQLTAECIRQLPSSERVRTLGQSLVDTMSPQWLGRPAGMPSLSS